MALARTRDGWPFLAVAGAVSLLAALGPLPVWAGLLHHVALPPLDLFADVRVLLARAGSYPVFVLGLVASLIVRSVVLAAALGGVTRRRMAGALAFYAVALVPALVTGSLAFSALAVLYALFLWSAVGVSLVMAVLLAPVPWAGCGWMRRPLRPMAIVLGYLAVLLVMSTLSAEANWPARILLLWVSVLLTVAAARRLAVGRRRQQPAAPTGAPAATAVVLLVASTLVPIPAPADAPTTVDAGTLFLVAGTGTRSGVGSLFEFDPATIGFPCERTAYFSYAGPGGGAARRESACPIPSGEPYQPSDTLRSPDELVASFHQQVAALPGPVVVVTHSQGGWVARAALADGELPNVTTLVMLAPFPNHALSYVPAGERGAGIVGSDAMRLIVGTVREAGHTSFDPSAPLPSQFLATPGAIERAMGGSAPHPARALAITPWVDLPVLPEGWRTPGAVDACPIPILHGDLFTAPAVTETIRRFLEGEPLDGCPWWRRRLPAVGEAFAVPTGP